MLYLLAVKMKNSRRYVCTETTRARSGHSPQMEEPSSEDGKIGVSGLDRTLVDPEITPIIRGRTPSVIEWMPSIRRWLMSSQETGRVGSLERKGVAKWAKAQT